MDLPSFLWLWKIAAWSMGLSLLAYVLLAVTGFWMFRNRTSGEALFFLGNDPHKEAHSASPTPQFLGSSSSIRNLHYIIGISIVSLVLLLLAVGIVGTLGHYGSLGHSSHLWAGLTAVGLVLLSAASAMLINTGRLWARYVHITVNILLLFVFVWVSFTGWGVVQKYLP